MITTLVVLGCIVFGYVFSVALLFLMVRLLDIPINAVLSGKKEINPKLCWLYWILGSASNGCWQALEFFLGIIGLRPAVVTPLDGMTDEEMNAFISSLTDENGIIQDDVVLSISPEYAGSADKEKFTITSLGG